MKTTWRTIFSLAFVSSLFPSLTAAQTPFSTEPVPAYQAQVRSALAAIQGEASIQRRIRTDRALNAFYIQTVNQLRHVSLSFTMRDMTYTHDYVLTGPYPKTPTELALQRAEEFMTAAAAQPIRAERQAVPSERFKFLLDEQKAWVKKITASPLDMYSEMHLRMKAGGVNVAFPELGSVVEYLRLHLISNEAVINQVNANPVIASFWKTALRYLDEVATSGYPYIRTVEGIQRALEFLDVFHRANDSSRSPKLYHSDRYDYYGHFLKAEAPDHIMIPTIVSLGATDILKARGVTIGFIGVNTDITWVDGFYQTPYEFWVHDINHSRRMWQFFKETAERRGLSILEFAQVSNTLVREKLIPLITIRAGEDDTTKNLKRLLKVLLFEILHEDALAADVDVILNAIQRPPNLITPFEEMKRNDVTYVMEPGATTLAYAFRKLAHDFYDMPGERMDNIVAEKFRTREGIVEVALTLGRALGADLRREVLEYYVSTDLGFPKDFKSTLEKDIKSRPGETIALDSTKETTVDVIAIVAELAHAKWQTTTAYFERWKPAQTAFKDGTGVNDGKFVTTQADLKAYFMDRRIPKELQKYFEIRTGVNGKSQLFEDIQHLPHKFLAPNNQYENIEGAKVAVRLVRRIAQRGLQFTSVEQAMTWIRAAAQEQNLEWLRRNRHWAKGNPVYDRHWKDLGAVLKANNLNLFKIAFEAELGIDSGLIESRQQVVLKEGLRRLYVDIGNQAMAETRIAMAGERIHAAWQLRSGYTEHFKPTDAHLDDGRVVTTESELQQYLRERSIPPQFHRYFRLGDNGGKIELFEDIQNLPFKFLALNHRVENEIAADFALSLVERLWSRGSNFRSVLSAERWIKAAAQSIHTSFLRRNASSGHLNQAFSVHWLELPAAQQIHDLDAVKSALMARFEFSPMAMPQAQKLLLLEAIRNLEVRVASGGVRRSCAEWLESK